LLDSVTMKSDTEHISIFGYINNFYNYVLNLKIFNQVLPKTRTNNSTNNKDNKDIKQVNINKEVPKNDPSPSAGLFPTKINYQNDLFNNSTIKPCSMEVSKLTKVINSDGTITWDINPDHQIRQQTSTITSPFLTSTGSTISTNDELSPNALKFSNQKDTPSPYNINENFTNHHKSDEDSTHSLDEIIPDLPHPDFFDIGEEEKEQQAQQQQQQQQKEERQQQQLHQGQSSSSSPKPSSKTFTCEYCDAEFKIRGYLTRHIKKHAINKAYECPFFNPNSENRCHPNGGFSRRDTYKTHLKARHFKYPQGTRSQDRPNTPGKCGMCGKNYLNNEDWVEHHIENGECEMLPQGYEGRVKNSRRRNYEFPSPNSTNHNTPNIDDNSSSHSSGNDDFSPNTQQCSPNTPLIPNPLSTNTASSVQIPIVSSLKMNSTKPMMMPVMMNNGNDYDENDEFSLDTEQCYSFYRY